MTNTTKQPTPEATDLREGLHAAGVTLRDLAVHLGVTEGAVHQQLTGRRPLQRRTEAVARELIKEKSVRLLYLAVSFCEDKALFAKLLIEHATQLAKELPDEQRTSLAQYLVVTIPMIDETTAALCLTPNPYIVNREE